MPNPREIFFPATIMGLPSVFVLWPSLPQAWLLETICFFSTGMERPLASRNVGLIQFAQSWDSLPWSLMNSSISLRPLISAVIFFHTFLIGSIHDWRLGDNARGGCLGSLFLRGFFLGPLFGDSVASWVFVSATHRWEEAQVCPGQVGRDFYSALLG